MLDSGKLEARAALTYRRNYYEYGMLRTKYMFCDISAELCMYFTYAL